MCGRLAAFMNTSTYDVAAEAGMHGKDTPVSPGVAYRFFRVLMTGVNDGGSGVQFSRYLTLGGLELYGDVFDVR